MHDRSGRSDHDRHAEGELLGRDLHRPKPRTLVLESHCGHHTSGPTRPPRIHLRPPFGELGQQIRVVQKPALFEERALHPADEIFDRSFCSGLNGQQTSIPSPRSSATPAKSAFHSVTCPSLAHCKATVFGRSNTAKSGIPPIAVK
jgi:hypothetical protein